MKNIQLYILILALAFLSLNTAQASTTSKDTAYIAPIPFTLSFQVSPLSTKLTSDKYASEETGQIGFNFGANLAYCFYSNSKWKISVSAGLGFTQYATQRNLNDSNTVSTVDPDNDPVIIKEKTKNLIENQTVLFLDIPIRLIFDLKFDKQWSAYLNIGAVYGLGMSAKYDNTATLTRTGFYPKTNITLYNIDVPNSPFFYPKDKPMTGSGDITTQSNLALEVGLGVKYQYNKKFSLFAGLRMMNGLSNIKSGTSPFQLAKPDFHLNTLSNRSDNVSAIAYGIEVGAAFALNLGTHKGVSRK